MARAEPVGEQTDLIDQVIEDLPEGVAVTDPDGRIVFVNHRLEELTRYPRRALLGATFELLLPDDLVASHRGRLARYHSFDHAHVADAAVETVLRRAGGSEIPVDLALSRVNSRDGHFVITTIRDARERHGMHSLLRLIDDRERMTRELQANVIQAVFGVALELQTLADLEDDRRVAHRLGVCVAVLDDCIIELRERGRPVAVEDG